MLGPQRRRQDDAAEGPHADPCPLPAGRHRLRRRRRSPGPPACRWCGEGCRSPRPTTPIFRDLTVRAEPRAGSFRCQGQGRGRAAGWTRSAPCSRFLGDRAASIAGRFSGGQQRQLSLGIALMAHPRLMLLDEPSLGISPAVVEATFATIKRPGPGPGDERADRGAERRPITAIVDRVYVLRNGAIVLEETGRRPSSATPGGTSSDAAPRPRSTRDDGSRAAPTGAQGRPDRRGVPLRAGAGVCGRAVCLGPRGGVLSTTGCEVNDVEGPDHQPPARPGPSGVSRGLTSYGDAGFSRFLRGVFLSGAGFDATSSTSRSSASPTSARTTTPATGRCQRSSSTSSGASSRPAGCRWSSRR